MRARPSPRPAGARSCLGGWTKTLIFIVLSPLIGMVAGLALMIGDPLDHPRPPPSRVDRWFRRLQLVSAAFFSLSHGANDAQKTMGIIAGVLFAAGYIQTFYIPIWVMLAAHTAIALGTLAGGWRIIHTMGSKITKLQPVGGFAAETGAAIAALIATRSASASARRTRSPARLSASARRGGCRRCAGASRADCLGVAADDSRGVRDQRRRGHVAHLAGAK